MRIVQVSPYDLNRHGGVQQHILSLASDLRKRGHDVLVIGPGAAVPGDAQSIGIGSKRQVSFVGTSFELSWASGAELRSLAQTLEEWRPDVVHYHTIWVPMLPWQIFRQTKVASVATFHDTPPPGFAGSMLRAAFRLLSRYFLQRLEGAIAVSTAPLRHLRPGPRGTIPVVIPPATDLTRYLGLKRAGAGDRQKVLYFGRLEPRKGIDVLLKAWQLIARREVPLPANREMPQHVVAGRGELEPLLVEASKWMSADILQHVEAPDQESLLRLLSEATIAVSPALYGESFGIVLVEALASGTPVIASSNAGYVNVMTGRGQSLLVAPGDAHALARRIVDLLCDNSALGTLGQWGREHARQFDIAAVSPRIEAVYRAAKTRYRRSNSPLDGNQA